MSPLQRNYGGISPNPPVGLPIAGTIPASSANSAIMSSHTYADSPARGMPRVGTAAPHFEARAVMGGRIKDIDLAQFISANSWLILAFIPMAWSFVCPTEIQGFDRRLHEFSSRDCAVIFCSTDSEFVLRAWNHTSEEEGGLGGVQVPLVSDRSHRIAEDYGVLIENEGVTQRTMFIIDPLGVVRQITTNDANVGRSVDEARRLIDALKFTDEFGEGCPVDWRKGERGLSLDVEGAVRKRDSNESNPPIASVRPNLVRGNTWGGRSGYLADREDESGSNTPTQSNVPKRASLQNQVIKEEDGESEVDSRVKNWKAKQQNDILSKRASLIEAAGHSPRSTPDEIVSKGGYFDRFVPQSPEQKATPTAARALSVEQ